MPAVKPTRAQASKLSTSDIARQLLEAVSPVLRRCPTSSVRAAIGHASRPQVAPSESEHRPLPTATIGPCRMPDARCVSQCRGCRAAALTRPSCANKVTAASRLSFQNEFSLAVIQRSIPRSDCSRAGARSANERTKISGIREFHKHGSA